MNDTQAPSAALGVHSGPAAADQEGSNTQGAPRTGRLSLGPDTIAWIIGVSSLLLPLAWGGLWAPYELDVADLSRRIAVALHGAPLAVPGAENTVPILAELGKGQLPFSSVALGFQLFGLSDWAGRLPLALWGGLGLLSCYAMVSRFVDRIAGLYATLILATTPLYFLQARTMLGDGVTLAAVAVATCSLALPTFHPQVSTPSQRAGWLTLALGALLSGFAARGVLLGVACPALGVGLAWSCWRLSGQRCPTRFAEAVGIVSLTVGALSFALGAWVLSGNSAPLYLELLGSRLQPPAVLPTHDGMLHQLGFGLLPWSAVAPFAIALALRPTSEQTAARAAATLCLSSVLGVALAAHGLSAPQTGAVPFVATFAIAGLLGIAFRDAESPAARTRLMALGAAALLIIFYSDLRTNPEQALEPFAIAGASFPESFAATAKAFLKGGTLFALVLVATTLGDLPTQRTHCLREDGEATRWLHALRRGWKGYLPWVLSITTAALVVAAVAVFLSDRGIIAPVLAPLGPSARVLRFAFVAVPVIIIAPIALWLGRDVIVAALSFLPAPRPRVAVAGLTLVGLSMSLGYYPALAAHLSPRNVFEGYGKRAHPGEPLGVLGEAARVAPYYTDAAVHAPRSARAGLEWLIEDPAQRRWLVLPSDQLAQLNYLYRKQAKPRRNLPIVDSISSEVLLASNRPAVDTPDENPLSGWISSTRPEPQVPLEVDLEGKLRCLGWGITDLNGIPVERVHTGRKLQFRIYWEVSSAITGTWKTFIHIDGKGRRFNGDHDTLEGKVPFRYWQKGDFITDIYPIELERHFAGTTYEVYFGLFAGKKRLNVVRGQHHENRIKGGPLVVN